MVTCRWQTPRARAEDIIISSSPSFRSCAFTDRAEDNGRSTVSTNIVSHSNNNNRTTIPCRRYMYIVYKAPMEIIFYYMLQRYIHTKYVYCILNALSGVHTTAYDNNNLTSQCIDNNVSPVDGKSKFKERLPGERSSSSSFVRTVISCVYIMRAAMTNKTIRVITVSDGYTLYAHCPAWK